MPASLGGAVRAARRQRGWQRAEREGASATGGQSCATGGQGRSGLAHPTGEPPPGSPLTDAVPSGRCCSGCLGLGARPASPPVPQAVEGSLWRGVSNRGQESRGSPGRSPAKVPTPHGAASLPGFQKQARQVQRPGQGGTRSPWRRSLDLGPSCPRQTAPRLSPREGSGGTPRRLVQKALRAGAQAGCREPRASSLCLSCGASLRGHVCGRP